MTCNKWRRTDLNGEIAPDDWTLRDPSGEPLAHLYKVFGSKTANGIGPFYSCQTAA
jgi:hypothetical protein